MDDDVARDGVFHDPEECVGGPVEIGWLVISRGDVCADAGRAEGGGVNPQLVVGDGAVGGVEAVPSIDVETGLYLRGEFSELHFWRGRGGRSAHRLCWENAVAKGIRGHGQAVARVWRERRCSVELYMLRRPKKVAVHQRSAPRIGTGIVGAFSSSNGPFAGAVQQMNCGSPLTLESRI